MKRKSTPDAMIPAMTPTEFSRALDRLGFSQIGLARFTGRDARTVRRWAAGEPIPSELALLLRLMVRFKVTPPTACRTKEKR
jgi:DNA-binding transcriptional regulator YiaG